MPNTNSSMGGQQDPNSQQSLSEKGANAWRAMKNAAQSVTGNTAMKGRPTWAYDDRRKRKMNYDEKEEEQVSRSFTAKRFIHNIDANMFIELIKGKKPKSIAKTAEKKFTTAAGNPWTMKYRGAVPESPSVGYDENGLNDEPSRVQRSMSAGSQSFSKRINPFMSVGPNRVRQPGEKLAQNGDFAPGQLVRAQEPAFEEEENEQRDLRNAGTNARLAAHNRTQRRKSMDKANDSTKIRDKISPEMEQYFNTAPFDKLQQNVGPGGNKMAQEFIGRTKSSEPVTVTKAAVDHDMMAEMMSARFGYRPQKVLDGIASMNKSEPNAHAIEHGSVFELHQSNDGTYIVAPIGYGSLGSMALPIAPEYANVFETDLTKAKIRAQKLQQAEMRKSFVEVDSEYHYRDQMDTLLAKAYKFSKAEQPNTESPKNPYPGPYGEFDPKYDEDPDKPYTYPGQTPPDSYRPSRGGRERRASDPAEIARRAAADRLLDPEERAKGYSDDIRAGADKVKEDWRKKREANAGNTDKKSWDGMNRGWEKAENDDRDRRGRKDRDDDTYDLEASYGKNWDWQRQGGGAADRAKREAADRIRRDREAKRQAQQERPEETGKNWDWRRQFSREGAPANKIATNEFRDGPSQSARRAVEAAGERRKRSREEYRDRDDRGR